jgi:hypothetical protein
MSGSIFLDYECEEIAAAMAVTLLQHKNANQLTLHEIGRVIEREKQSVSQYINGISEMPASCWEKAKAKWPDLQERLIYNLDEAEKAFRAKQRSLRLDGPQPEQVAA